MASLQNLPLVPGSRFSHSKLHVQICRNCTLLSAVSRWYLDQTETHYMYKKAHYSAERSEGDLCDGCLPAHKQLLYHQSTANYTCAVLANLHFLQDTRGEIGMC